MPKRNHDVVSQDPIWTYLSGVAEIVVALMLLAYARLPLQLGLFYWAWALAKDIKIKSRAGKI
jgi:uncharacterized membrane protein